MKQEALSADTQVVLLLCGRFGGEQRDPYPPLGLREYGEFARWLNGRGLRPSDLLVEGAGNHLMAVQEAKLERQRIEFLLGRGTALALASERWARGGLWVISRGDAAFPRRLKLRLKHAAPPLLYGAGEQSLLESGGLAIIGSRDASESALDFARDVATRCANEGLTVVSGGARGVDAASMQGATAAGGSCIGVLAADLLKTSLNRQNRHGLQEGLLVLVSPFSPEAGFNAGNAMGRNRYIYTMADQALVVDSALRTGGTWAGAVENLQHRWVPMFVRSPGEGAGNPELMKRGAIPFTTLDVNSDSLVAIFEAQRRLVAAEVPPTQESLPLASASSASYFESPGARRAQVREQPQESTIDTPESAVESLAASAPALSGSDFDMFDAFVPRLVAALGDGTRTESELAAMMRLEKSQLKAWLKRAGESGTIEKLAKPVRYAIRRQGQLYGH